jgi:osmotically inducible lipoprotein OsmB
MRSPPAVEAGFFARVFTASRGVCMCFLRHAVIVRRVETFDYQTDTLLTSPYKQKRHAAIPSNHQIGTAICESRRYEHQGDAIMKTFHRIGALATVVAVVASLSACDGMTTRQRDTAIGAGVGGAAGAAIGGNALSTLGGAAVGGVIGNQVGK